MQSSFTTSRTALGVTIAGSGGQNFTFLPIDASLKPGIRAYNFLGHLPEDEFKNLHRSAEGKYRYISIYIFVSKNVLFTVIEIIYLFPLLF